MLPKHVRMALGSGGSPGGGLEDHDLVGDLGVIDPSEKHSLDSTSEATSICHKVELYTNGTAHNLHVWWEVINDVRSLIQSLPYSPSWKRRRRRYLSNLCCRKFVVAVVIGVELGIWKRLNAWPLRTSHP